jgi:hypothetical protein
MIYLLHYILLSLAALLIFVGGVYLAENDLKNNKGDRSNETI